MTGNPLPHLLGGKVQVHLSESRDRDAAILLGNHDGQAIGFLGDSDGRAMPCA